jgi:hypothetical protein
MRFLCNYAGSKESFVHCTFVGTRSCPARTKEGICENESHAFFFAPGLGGICLPCVRRLYPSYLVEIQRKEPENYAKLTKNGSQAMDEEVERALQMWDLVCSLWVAEVIEKFRQSGHELRKQTIDDRDCNVIRDAKGFDYCSYKNLVEEFICRGGPAVVTTHNMETAMWEGMKLWMGVFLRNYSEMDKAYEMLKHWRFEEPAKDDVFEQKFVISEMLQLKS